MLVPTLTSVRVTWPLYVHCVTYEVQHTQGTAYSRDGDMFFTKKEIIARSRRYSLGSADSLRSQIGYLPHIDENALVGTYLSIQSLFFCRPHPFSHLSSSRSFFLSLVFFFFPMQGVPKTLSRPPVGLAGQTALVASLSCLTYCRNAVWYGMYVPSQTL